MSTFTKRIDSNIRDVDHTKDGSTWYFDQDQAYNIGNPGSVTRNIGYRFTDITVPQGATITAAKITFTAPSPLFQSYPQSINIKIQGIAEDNTSEFVASPESSARTRTKTTASVTWSGNVSETANATFDTPDIKDIVQEIISRAGWSSGNAMAFFLSDNGSSSGKYLEITEYSESTTKAALLTIEYSSSPSSSVSPSISPSASLSPSASPSPSSSISPSSTPSPSLSPSASFSPSSSISSSVSPSSSPSASASPSPEDYGIKVAKPGINKNVQDITDPKEYNFTSALGVLGLKQLTTITDTTDASGNISKTVAHNIGYAPFTIVTFTSYNGTRVEAPVEWHEFYTAPGKQLVEVTETVDFKINGTNIVITLHAEQYNHDTTVGSNLSSRQYTFKVYYYYNEIVETV